jgi:hypothetical protein
VVVAEYAKATGALPVFFKTRGEKHNAHARKQERDCPWEQNSAG